MSLTLVTAVALFALCPFLLRAVLGKDRWLSRPFSMFVLAAVLYHGASEVVIRLTNAGDRAFRPERHWIDDGALVTAISLLLMTVVYLIVHRREIPPPLYDRAELARVLDWRILAVLCVPLIGATVSGAGYQATTVQTTGDTLNSQGFAGSFLIPLLVLTTFAFVLRHPRKLVPAAAVQCFVMALAGQRLEIAITALLLWLLCRRVGIGIERNQAVFAAVIGVLLMVGLTSARSATGRIEFQEANTNGDVRAKAIVEGVLHPQYRSVEGENGPIADAAVRLNANPFPGRTAEAFSYGREPIGVGPIYYTAVLAVPSVLFPDKVTALTERQRSAKLWESEDMGMPQGMDFLPGTVTFFYPALGLWGQFLFSLLMGALLGWADTWALRRQGPVGFLALLTLTQAALFYERGWGNYLLTFRVFLVAGVVLFGWDLFRARLGHQRQAVPNVARTWAATTGSVSRRR